FERLVAELSPERSLSHSPLFQVAFTLDDAEDTGGGLAGMSVQGIGAELQVAKLDLSLGLTVGSDGARGGLTYSTDLWEAATMQRLVGHFTRLVEQAAADPDVRISQVTLVDEAERRQVVEEWNRTPVGHPTGACIHELVAAQAERTPEALAVVSGEDALTYHELDARANRLARRLAELGAGPEVRVGICLERSAGMVVAMLAVLKAGAAYLPLDPAYTADRLAYMLADSGARVLVTLASLRGLLPAEGVRTVLVDADAAEVAAEPDVAPRTAVAPENAAYVIYTSGSTGRPKGVVVTHANAANLLPRAVRTFGAEPGGAVLQTASMSFDASLLEVFVALLSGAALHVADREVVLAPERLAALLREREIGVWVSTPALLDSLPEADFPALRTISTGGERCPAETAARWSRGRRLVNMYGPTETTIYTTAHECAPGVAEAPPIGRPVEGARVYVLDAWGEPAPIGVPGELYVGGAGVARGYLERPALTAERFVPDAFGGEPGARLYRTGDRARWRADGELEYLGRLDEQVKVRGFRIELGEIEGALRRSEGVADCVVVAREDVPGEKRLVAYVVGDVEAGVLREHLRRELPEYMVPAAFVPLERLPLTPNGKLDRKALPAPEGDAYARAGYEAPLGEVEAALAGIWAEVLGVERVGRWDHFFELGGHSLLAIKLIERMRRAGLYTDVRALFTTPVLAELALAVGGASSEVEVPANGIPEGCELLTPEMLPLVELSQSEIDRIVAEVAGGAANVQDIYPLAPLQEGILFHHLLSREGDPYLLSSVTEFDTRARLEQYLAALQAVIDRHDVLRTAVAWEGLSEPVQVVWRQASLPVEEVELDAEAEDAAGQLWQR
ncbi:MAG TPA: amino acid adenylation domain-containing protein, partial [Longimicrobiaceae bacterium]|nr:amino acid adenylation domain-containing protein [Longimicrobiaceae bacterium]